ncbi:MAG: hypothetical protein RLY86_2530 [Pseudomonadota bacterium]|jgi:carboxypeptidase Taq
MPAPAVYAALEARFARRSAVQGALGILNWDTRTMMPEAAMPARAEQVAALEGVLHGMLVDPALADLLAEAESQASALDDWQRANLAEMRRMHDLAAALPADLVEASARATARAEMQWREAKRSNDFALLLPALREVLDRQREEAARRAGVLGCGLYDALHDRFEPGSRVAAFAPLFAEYADWLPGFLERVEAAQAARPEPLPMPGPFDLSVQLDLARQVAGRLGFTGRLDRTLHAFCGGAAGDVRITTRLDGADWFKAFKSSLHETGHALYELGRPAAWLHQPVGEARGLAVHESQSLMLDMQVGRHPAFIAWVAPILAEGYGRGGDPAWTARNLQARLTRVERSFIRVDADEVTYPAHVILRWRLEQALVEGGLDLADLPQAWNQGFRDLLGVAPPSDALGCLQDVHWPSGLWGYFPTYSLGAMMAAQLFRAAATALPDLEGDLARGDIAPLLGWLRDSVHRHGRRLSADELLIRATGKPLGIADFQRHLEGRYLGEG